MACGWSPWVDNRILLGNSFVWGTVLELQSYKVYNHSNRKKQNHHAQHGGFTK
jgi:hypothetical protein